MGRLLAEHESLALLAGQGVPVVHETVAATPADAAAADAAQLPRRLEAIMTGELTRMRGAREAVAS